MARIHELRLIARVAQMYHVEQLRQADIARHLRLSQASVSRILKRAQDEGIVRTSIAAPTGTYGELEQGLRERFDLPEAIVVECTEDRDGAIMARIGEAAAHFIEMTLQPGEVVGISSWSETILKMVDNIYPMKAGRAKYVVQTLGGMGNPSVQTHATQLTTRLANLIGAEPRLLTAHGVAQSREAKLVMLSDPYVRETIDLFGKITLAIVGIGAIEPSRMLAGSGNVFSEGELSELKEAGAVGDISLRFFDRQGRTVKTPLDDRVIGMDMEALSQVDRAIGLAGGKAKTEAVAGALKAGVLSVLITDKFTAARLLGRESEFSEEAEVA
ncbi:MAG: sugar-binding transcriptional regulator [Rhizobiales bacterium]|nr:sugar-binding transcriptional regulator [Hyphomicrobiales bacterium]